MMALTFRSGQTTTGSDHTKRIYRICQGMFIRSSMTMLNYTFLTKQTTMACHEVKPIQHPDHFFLHRSGLHAN